MGANASQNSGKVRVQEALDFAIQHHTEGRLLDARSVYEKILHADPKQPIALHFLGVVAHQLGENEVAVDLISKAIEIVPDFAAAYSNLGLALQGLGRHEEAIGGYQKAIEFDPEIVEAHYNLGNLLKEMGRLDAAVNSYQQAIAISPNYVEAHNSIGTAFKELGRLDEAVASYFTALEIQGDYVETYINLGIAFRTLGQIDNAIANYRKALVLDPGNIAAHNNLGLALKELEQVDEAIECYRQALTLDPDNAEMLSNLAVALQELGRLDEAEVNYRRALVLQPGNAEVHYNLCETLERANNTDALQDALKNAQNNCPGDPFLALKEAQLLMRQSDYATGRAILEAAGKGSEDVQFLKERAFLLGALCDRLGDSTSAFNYFEDGNSRSRTTVVAQKGNGAQSLAQVRALEELFSTDWIATWQYTDSRTDCVDPVFLVGFPRSGTTLLDMILRSHPDVSVVEEQPTLRGVRAALERDHENYQDGLPDLNTDQLSELRHLYFNEVNKFLKPEDRSAVFIDKMPLNIIDAGLIHRIFPRARFLFAQRHPCDCVLSCFMQNFKINEGMSHFLDLEDAAEFYDKVMALWQHYQTVLPLDVHVMRYESLIEAFDETVAPLLNFLDLEWDESVRSFAETAQRQGRINTPSYGQVVRPLYTHARNRWENYREQMQPVLPVLLPWAKKYGYET